MGEDGQGNGFAGADRRQAERIPARLGVRFRGTEEVARAIKAYSLNFSVGGLCLKTQKSYRVGDPLELSMVVAGEEFQLNAMVAWVRQGIIGVRFVDVSDEDKDRLTAMVAKLRP